MGGIGVPELLVVLAVLLLLFGATKLPKLARSMGEASKEFKQGMRSGGKQRASVEGPCPFCQVDVPEDAKFCPGCGKQAEEIIIARESTAKSA
jgi:sec-independent protein translocase protein TatA